MQQQAETIEAWAQEYEALGAGNGAAEAAFLLRRAARQIRRILGDEDSAEPIAPASTREPVVETRADEAAAI